VEDGWTKEGELSNSSSARSWLSGPEAPPPLVASLTPYVSSELHCLALSFLYAAVYNFGNIRYCKILIWALTISS
jgi:hypothetical protein